MSEGFDGFITAVESYIPTALISRENISRIKGLTRLLPAKISTFFGFECRLGEANPRADFLIHIQASEAGREILAGIDSQTGLPDFFRTNTVWQRVRLFCKEWADVSSVINRKADHIWLEFDIVENDDITKPIPSIFFGPSGIEANAAETTPRHQWVVEDALRLIMGDKLPPSMEKKIHQCFDLLPPGSHAYQIGTMLSRPLRAVRVCVKYLSPEAVADYISSLRWDGSVQEVRELCADLSRFVDRIALDIDVINDGPTFIGPKIGLECYIDAVSQTQNHWANTLDYLLERNICLPTKRDALLEYPGNTDEWSDRTVWPEHLLGLSSFLGIHAASVLQRMLHHVKIVYHPDQPLEAKAYLAVYHAWGKPMFERERSQS
jgi:hypothetical protein